MLYKAHILEIRSVKARPIIVVYAFPQRLLALEGLLVTTHAIK